MRVLLVEPDYRRGRPKRRKPPYGDGVLWYRDLGKPGLARRYIQRSLDGRSPSDRTGIASCKKALSEIAWDRIQRGSVRTPPRNDHEFCSAWNLLWESLVEFKELRDAQGISGTVELMCQMGEFALVRCGWSHWRTPLTEILREYFDECLPDYRDRIAVLQERLKITLPPNPG